MWSLTNPSGTITTALRPAAGSSAIASLMSGSSHGIEGGPLRDWYTSCHGTSAAGRRAVVIVPLGFVSDHVEVLWDLDNEALETAGEHGLAAVRVPTPGTHPAYVAGLVDLVLERVNGTPAAERPAVTELGPWYDVCRPGCCENVRLGFRPALAGIAP